MALDSGRIYDRMSLSVELFAEPLFVFDNNGQGTVKA